MKKRLNILTCAGVLCLLFSGPALANPSETPSSTTNVRGMVVVYNSYAGRYVAASGVRIDLYEFNAATGQWRLVETAYTDVNGYYFFTDIKPKTYTLQVNEESNFEIEVEGTEDLQDIPPVRLR